MDEEDADMLPAGIFVLLFPQNKWFTHIRQSFFRATKLVVVVRSVFRWMMNGIPYKILSMAQVDML